MRDGDLGVAVIEHPIAAGLVQRAGDVGHGPGRGGEIGGGAKGEAITLLERTSRQVEVAVRAGRPGDVSRGGGIARHVHRAGGLIVNPDTTGDIAARMAEQRHVSAHIHHAG